MTKVTASKSNMAKDCLLATLDRVASAALRSDDESLRSYGLGIQNLRLQHSSAAQRGSIPRHPNASPTPCEHAGIPGEVPQSDTFMQPAVGTMQRGNESKLTRAQEMATPPSGSNSAGAEAAAADKEKDCRFGNKLASTNRTSQAQEGKYQTTSLAKGGGGDAGGGWGGGGRTPVPLPLSRLLLILMPRRRKRSRYHSRRDV